MGWVDIPRCAECGKEIWVELDYHYDNIGTGNHSVKCQGCQVENNVEVQFKYKVTRRKG